MINNERGVVKMKLIEYYRKYGKDALMGKEFIDGKCQDRTGIKIINIRGNEIEHHGIATLYCKAFSTNLTDLEMFLNTFGELVENKNDIGPLSERNHSMV